MPALSQQRKQRPVVLRKRAKDTKAPNGRQGFYDYCEGKPKGT